jgi:prepilin-type N-terminal cleavage/methylation domain-containing protein/prepilin-type processing-associated H-X9-DG protein
MQRLPIRRGFTLIELLVVIAIIAILAAILFPVFAQAREKARQTVCLSNVKQMSLGFYMYAQDYDETLPVFGGPWPSPRVFWNDLIVPYTKNTGVQECPSWTRSGKYPNQRGQLVGGTFGFAVNYGIRRGVFGYDSLGKPRTLTELDEPASLMLFTDGQGGRHIYNPMEWPMTLDWDRDGLQDSHTGVFAGEGPYNRGDPFRHSSGANCGFADGHAKWVTAKAIISNQNDLWGSRLPLRAVGP